MEWDLKVTPWDLADVEQDAKPSLGSLVCSSSVLGCYTDELDCSVDLKLGGLGGFGSSNKVKVQTRMLIATLSPSISSKRARAPSSGIQIASCLVDGCNADLSNCREYHRRHKVCEIHSKTPIVLVNGQEKRFCQQCSRFHLLVEFDEVKRSCRKRLDGHNRRRRKPQPVTINTGNVFVDHQGPRSSKYSQIFSTTSESNWSAVVKTEKDALYGHDSRLHFIDRQQQFPGSFPHGCGEGKQLAFLQGDESSLSNGPTETSFCQPLLNTIASSENSNKKFDGLTQVFDSDGALFLLSSPTQTPGINLSNTVPADQIPTGQPLVSNIHQYGGLSCYSCLRAIGDVSPTGFFSSTMEDEHIGTVRVTDASDAGLHFPGMFHIGADGTSNRASQAILFSWQ